jgi:hypothetical protein
MNKKHRCLISLLFSLSVTGCLNSNSEAQHSENKAKDTVSAKTQTPKSYDSLMNMSDLYEYENDTILQQAYVHYLSPVKINFLLRVTNKRNSKVCEVSDTGVLAYYPSDPDALDDELAGGELYPAYQFGHEKGASYIYVSVEPSRGKRLIIQASPDYKKACLIGSLGTLRRKKLSSVAQQGPSLPKIPAKE